MRNLILVALAASAAATPALAQEGDFSGPRAEAIIGWDNSRVPLGDANDGLVYGGAIGYDLQRGNTVFGIEGEITGATTKSEALAPNSTWRGSQDRDLYVGGRVGFTVRPNTLIYAKAGYTNLRTKLEIETSTGVERGGGITGGYRLGAGAEVKLGENAYLKGEYRYSDYGSSGRHQVVTGLGVRF
jgi:outer membrane immunogenic protein